MKSVFDVLELVTKITTSSITHIEKTQPRTKKDDDAKNAMV